MRSPTAVNAEFHDASLDDTGTIAGRIGAETDDPTCALAPRNLLASKALGAVLLIPAIPIIAVLVLLVRLTSRGPGIYRQRRVGYRGQEFVMLKIRSMRQDAEAETGPIWATKGDTRATTIGKLLRRSHLDELPQLWNVLRGEMCLVGPRPERPEIVQQLELHLQRYRERLEVPPGITGLAQIRQGPDTDLESARSKLALDLAYLQQLAAGRWIDARIGVASVLILCRFSQDWAAKLCGLNTIEPVAIETTQVDTASFEETRRRAA